MSSNLLDSDNNSETVQTQVYRASMDPSHSHFRHVLTLLGRQRRDAGDTVRLQTLYHGEGAPAGRWAAPQDRCRGQAEQGERQEQHAHPGLRRRSHTQKRGSSGDGDGDGATISALLRPTKRQRGALRRSGSARTEWTSPAGRGLKLSSSCTEQQEEQASDGPLGTRWWWAGASLLPSCIMEEGRGTTTGVRVTRHLWKWEWEGREGGRVMKMRRAEDEDEEMRYKTVINHPVVPSHRRLHTPTQPGSSGHHSRSVKSDLLRSFLHQLMFWLIFKWRRNA